MGLTPKNKTKSEQGLNPESVDGIAMNSASIQDLKHPTGTTDNDVWSVVGGVSAFRPQTGGGGGVAMRTIVDVDGGGDYTTLTEAIEANHKSIFLKNGVYNEGNIKLLAEDIDILGESKTEAIIRVPAGKDGVQIYANRCKVSSLTIDSETNNAEACLVIGDGQPSGNADTSFGNFNKVDNCIIKGNDHVFALFVAGASYSAGVDTLNNFEANNLNEGNEITNCEFTSLWTAGDAYSFALQKLGKISNNMFISGRIAYYMCRESECKDNKVVNSTREGIFIGCPAYDNVITGNILSNPQTHGIKMENQLEHIPLLTGQTGKNNIISGNVIVKPLYTGIEILGTTGHEMRNNIIANNSIKQAGNHGIYLQRVTLNSILGNTIVEPRTDVVHSRGSGIYMVLQVTDNLIANNTIIDERFPHVCHTAISNREGSDCQGNSILGNIINCNNVERTVWFQSNRTTIANNSISGGYYAGIRLEGASNCSITANSLNGNTKESNNAYFEIWVQSSASSNIIKDNVISAGSNIANGAINIDGSGSVDNIVKDNVNNGCTNDLLDTGTGTIKD